MQRSYIASGNVSPCRAVIATGGSTGSETVAQAGASPSTPAIGISQQWLEGPPGTLYDTGYAASSGKPILVYQEDEICPAEAGAAFNAGAFLMPDSNGRFITCTSGNYYVAVAFDAATAAQQRCRVTVLTGKLA